MIHLTQDNGVPKVKAETYTLTFPSDRPFAYLDGADGRRIADLFLLSSVHPLHGRDDSARLLGLEIAEAPGRITISLHAASSVWRHKTFRLICQPRGLRYEIEVEGSGSLAEVNFLGGYYSGHVRWGSGFFRSGQSFRLGFNPEPNSREVNDFSPTGSAAIDLSGVPLPGRDDWFFTPPPFCFAFETAGGWLGLGVEAAPGANRFTDYHYHGEGNSFHLSLAYDGHTAIHGITRLPAIGFYFGGDEYQVLAAHVQALQVAGLVPQAASVDRPGWWREPIFCGWGAQCSAAARDRGRAPDYARQSLYEQFLGTLTGNGLNPGTVVLDDKWQAAYGDNCADVSKWPDLPGFVTAQHAAGRKVLLWLKAWDPEGVPAEECITNAAGLPIAVDPTNPAFQRRLQTQVEQMLSPAGYDADGFKIDFTARIPAGPGLCTYGDAWGLELMRLYLALIHDAARACKPDALIIAHTPHPYLTDVVDMIRLNDINTGHDVPAAMLRRARLARIACPGTLIDADNWPLIDRATWRQYVRLQPELGVPSLYYASSIDATQEPLAAEDYQLVRDVWTQHRAGASA